MSDSLTFVSVLVSYQCCCSESTSSTEEDNIQFFTGCCPNWTVTVLKVFAKVSMMPL